MVDERRSDALLSMTSPMPMVLFTFDCDGMAHWASRAGFESPGMEPATAYVGRTLFDIHADFPQNAAAVRRCLAGESIEAVLPYFDSVWDTRLQPVFDDDGQVVGGRCMALDITQRVRAEAEARAAVAVTLRDATQRHLVDEERRAHAERLETLNRELVVDPAHLDRILTNLIDNADTYGRPPIEVIVRTRPTCVDLLVVDHGDGIPEGFRPRMWERFAQADSGDARSSRGLGLGLPIVAELARLDGLELCYEGDGAGARFRMTLPRASEEGPPR
jgi:signal transduction histidine kinase